MGEGLHYSSSLMGLANASVPAPAVVNSPAVTIQNKWKNHVRGQGALAYVNSLILKMPGSQIHIFLHLGVWLTLSNNSAHFYEATEARTSYVCDWKTIATKGSDVFERN